MPYRLEFQTKPFADSTNGTTGSQTGASRMNAAIQQGGSGGGDGYASLMNAARSWNQRLNPQPAQRIGTIGGGYSGAAPRSWGAGMYSVDKISDRGDTDGGGVIGRPTTGGTTTGGGSTGSGVTDGWTPNRNIGTIGDGVINRGVTPSTEDPNRDRSPRWRNHDPNAPVVDTDSGGGGNTGGNGQPVVTATPFTRGEIPEHFPLPGTPQGSEEYMQQIERMIRNSHAYGRNQGLRDIAHQAGVGNMAGSGAYLDMTGDYTAQSMAAENKDVSDKMFTGLQSQRDRELQDAMARMGLYGSMYGADTGLAGTLAGVNQRQQADMLGYNADMARVAAEIYGIDINDRQQMMQLLWQMGPEYLAQILLGGAQFPGQTQYGGGR